MEATNRLILSEAAKLYDSLGWLYPSTTQSSGTMKYQRRRSNSGGIPETSYVAPKIYGASSVAFAASIHLRVIDEHGSISTQL